VCTPGPHAGRRQAANEMIAIDFGSRHADRTEVWHRMAGAAGWSMHSPARATRPAAGRVRAIA